MWRSPVPHASCAPCTSSIASDSSSPSSLLVEVKINLGEGFR